MCKKSVDSSCLCIANINHTKWNDWNGDDIFNAVLFALCGNIRLDCSDN